MTDEPTDANLTPSAPPAAPPPPAPSGPAAATARSTNGAPVRSGVIAIGVATLIAVIALVLWDGGGSGPTPTAGSPNPESTGFPGGSGTDGGDSATVSPAPTDGASGDSSPQVAAAPLDPDQIAPRALMTSEPILAGVQHQWRVPGRVDVLADQYLEEFPQPGYSMQGGLGSDHPSGQTINVFIIQGPGGGVEPPAGSFLMMADPADPQNSTIIGLKIGR